LPQFSIEAPVRQYTDDAGNNEGNDLGDVRDRDLKFEEDEKLKG
jgi:hypothetical protein